MVKRVKGQGLTLYFLVLSPSTGWLLSTESSRASRSFPGGRRRRG